MTIEIALVEKELTNTPKNKRYDEKNEIKGYPISDAWNKFLGASSFPLGDYIALLLQDHIQDLSHHTRNASYTE